MRDAGRVPEDPTVIDLTLILDLMFFRADPPQL
jgi:hypothetical protein